MTPWRWLDVVLGVLGALLMMAVVAGLLGVLDNYL